MLRVVPCLLIAAALAGCGTVNPEPVGRANISNRVPVSLSVSDQRRFVLSGEKSPSFLGKSGNLNAYTADKAPLADHLKRDLLQELRSLGFDEQASSDSMQIAVTIQDWEMDGLYFWYDVSISVTSPGGNLLAHSVINDKKSLDIVGEGLFGITAGMPRAYGETIKALVRDNPDIYSALKTGMVSKKVEIKSPPAKKKFEQYVAIFKGNAQVADSQVTATNTPCFLCAPTTASQNFQFEKGNVAGIRWEAWWEYFGFALEFSSTHANSGKNYNSSSLNVGYESLSFIPMLRAPFFKTDSMPGGRLNLYAGVGLSSVLSGYIDVTIPPLPPVSGKTTGNGTVALIGASLNYSKLMLFVEQRATDTSLSYSYLGNSADVSVSANETVAGVAYRF